MASMTELITPKRQAEAHSAVERIGAFAVAARPEHLSTDIRQLHKRNILDSIGCAIAAVAGRSLRTLRDELASISGKQIRFRKGELR
jgi:2-methylcitrate dehydratase PrpD